MGSSKLLTQPSGTLYVKAGTKERVVWLPGDRIPVPWLSLSGVNQAGNTAVAEPEGEADAVADGEGDGVPGPPTFEPDEGWRTATPATATTMTAAITSSALRFGFTWMSLRETRHAGSCG